MKRPSQQRAVIVQQAIPYRRPATHPSRGVVHVAGNTEMPISQSPQPAPLGQGNDRHQSRRRHERFGSSNTAPATGWV